MIPYVRNTLVMLAAFAALGCSQQTSAQTAAPAATVDIHDFAYAPGTVTVAPGATVTWTNGDDAPHTIAADDRSYRSTPLDTNGTYSHTYTTPGEYHYFCTLHPQMTGVIVVSERASAASHADRAR